MYLTLSGIYSKFNIMKLNKLEPDCSYEITDSFQDANIS